MYCRICGENINRKNQDNVSPVSGYPVCQNCVQDLCCEECGSTKDLRYDEEYGLVLCCECLKNVEMEG